MEFILLASNRKKISSFKLMFLFITLFLVACDQEESTTQKDEDPMVNRIQTEPNEKHQSGSKIKIEYNAGILTIPKSFSSYSSVTSNRFFLEINTAWPDFGDKSYYENSDRENRIRFLLEVDKDSPTPFRDLHPIFKSRLKKGLYHPKDKDLRFNGLVGFKQKDQKFYSIYKVSDQDITTPMNTPLVMWCTTDKMRGQDMISKKGHCRYNLIMDPDLRIQVRFNKPLLNHFPEFHIKVMTFIKSIWTIK